MQKYTTTYANIQQFTDSLRSRGRYCFSREELKASFDISDKALNQALFRYSAKGKIARIRHGFYAIIPPEYSHYGMIPFELFIDDLMRSLNKRYYVSLFSAAAYHGAAHQKVMKSYVMTERPALRNIETDKLGINFYIKKAWSDEDIIKKKTDAGYINVSSPALTALDLLAYDLGLNRVFTVLEELVEEIKPKELEKAARNFPWTASVQRLGYLVHKELHNDKLADALRSVLDSKSLQTIPLLKGDKTRGETDTEWKVMKNIQVESDL